MYSVHFLLKLMRVSKLAAIVIVIALLGMAVPIEGTMASLGGAQPSHSVGTIFLAIAWMQDYLVASSEPFKLLLLGVALVLLAIRLRQSTPQENPESQVD
jgi:hypothetical protein